MLLFVSISSSEQSHKCLCQ